MKSTDLIPASCPCGLPVTYELCCGRWHQGPLHLQAPDAERLMRSRYSAFVLQRLDYLLDTWHPETRPSRLEALPSDLGWLGLEVRRHEQHDERSATVEFVARSKQCGRASRLHEVSRFEKLDGRWFYVDGRHQALR